LVGKNNKRQFFVRLNQLLVFLLPFSLWSLIKPLKRNSNYVLDSSGKVIVNYIGRTSQLNDDFNQIMKQFEASWLAEGVKKTALHIKICKGD
jgi:hypothetical protein